MKRPKVSWNGGRNGWHSFLLGVSYTPPFPGMGDHVLHIYLGFWLLTFRKPSKRRSP